MDYVIVPVTSGEMTIVAPGGERAKAQLGVGKSYFRKAGVEHDVLNETASEIVFLEVELKPGSSPGVRKPSPDGRSPLQAVWAGPDGEAGTLRRNRRLPPIRRS